MWALYCRSMFLWNSSSSIQRDDALTTEERARFAIEVFHETRDIQDALDMHKCNMDTGLAYVCREYLYECVCSVFTASPGCASLTSSAAPCHLCSTRMTITYELRRYVLPIRAFLPDPERL